VLSVLIFAVLLSGILIYFARFLGKNKGGLTAAVVLAALWLAATLGWAAGEWSGILAITMPSLIILIAGLMALPPFVLPVPPLPWKWPTVTAVLYTLLWLVSLWAGWLEMNAIGFLVFLPGLLLIFRPAFPLENVKPFVAILLFITYGIIASIVWLGLRSFWMNDSLNMLVLVQGVLVLSCYALPVTGTQQRWARQFALFFGIGYTVIMFAGRIDATVTNGLILLLGLAAFLRFAIPFEAESGTESLTSEFTTAAILVNYAMVWAFGLVTEELKITWFNALVFGIGASAILLPVLLKPSKNWETFKAIITFNLGTNYPYEAVAHLRLVTRAKGNRFGQLLGGPGIVLTNADHAVAVYSGAGFRRVSPPGVTFTHWAEEVQEIIDLRPQLRSLHPIVAKTKDGIDIEVVAFTPFRIATSGREVELGHPFPYAEVAIRKAIHAQRVAYEDEQKQGWDKLVRQTCERVMRDIIAEYTLDELSSLYDPARDPRAEIAARMRDGVRKQIEAWGLELIGGGISNLCPPEEVIQQRIEHWKAHWERKIKILEAEAEAEEERRLGIARAEAQMEMILRITEALEQVPTLDSERWNDLIVLRLLDKLGQAGAGYPGLMPKIGPSLERIRGSLGLLPPETRADETSQ
jgi:regulator of protease activity HflC (stomatin/prohibitin superfamily)